MRDICRGVRSFAGKFVVEAAESDTEGLNGAERIAEVHRKYFLRYPAKLHDDVIHCSKKIKRE